VTTFTAPDAFFSADFGGEPLRGEESFTGKTGTFPIIIYFHGGDDEGVGVTFSDFSPVEQFPVLREGFLAGTLAETAANNGGTVVSQKRVDFAGTTAVDGVIEFDGSVQHIRAVLLPPGHGYTISQIGPAGTPRSQEFERLLSSFKHLPTAR
jgi:hypothetical protein